MSVVPDKIAQLSNAELRRKLLQVGIQPAPLTPTTRKLYQMKLAQKLCEDSPYDTKTSEKVNKIKSF